MVTIEGAGGRLMAMLRFWEVADSGATVLESVTFTVNCAVVFGPVGVPEMTPALLKVKPAGSAPDPMAKFSVPAPPDDAMVWLYGVPSVPALRDVVVIVGGSVTVTITEFDLVVSATKVAVMVTTRLVDAAAT